jgi:hypothetical protein
MGTPLRKSNLAYNDVKLLKTAISNLKRAGGGSNAGPLRAIRNSEEVQLNI